MLSLEVDPRSINKRFKKSGFERTVLPIEPLVSIAQFEQQANLIQFSNS